METITRVAESVMLVVNIGFLAMVATGILYAILA